MGTIREVTRQAFGRQFEVDVLDALRADPVAWLDGLSFVATVEDRPVAHALLTRCHVGDTPILSLGPVSVLPAYQRQGGGGAAIRAALVTARELGEQSVVVLGHAEYYPRFGFRRAIMFGIRHPHFDGPNLMALSLTGEPLPVGELRYPVNA
ncbi:N-acetyltransferase [Kribbella turkmenica]|uniref:N-acetyltransferase n=1 Tax=Kribbella turkmenica TaxID=2530375 RepID=A0A4R4WLR0_9ACTN|nr:N-acetyltransferase [Kribbella turkmenica]